MKTNKSISRNPKVIAQAFFLALLSLTIIAQNTASTERNDLPLHARWAIEASRALDAKNYDLAAETAKQCTERFGDQAFVIQNRLRSTNAPVIPTGRITNEMTRTEIVSRGPLNDVAFCYLTIARARMAQYEQEPDKAEKTAKDLLTEAKKAYVKARSFSYAYVYAPQTKTFWRPAEAASRELKKESLVSHKE